MVEDASPPRPKEIDFRDLFLAQEDDDEDGASLADALSALAVEWPSQGMFTASDVATRLNQLAWMANVDKERVTIMREFLLPKLPPGQDASAKSIGKALKNHVGEPVKNHGSETLILKEWRDPHGGPKGALSYFVNVSR